MKHRCQLEVDFERIFPRVHPNASLFTRLRILWVKFIIIDNNNVEARRYFRSNARITIEKRRHLKECRYTIHPFSRFNNCRKKVLCILWTIALLHDSILTAFLNPTFGVPDDVVQDIFKYGLDLLLFIDVILNFWVGYYISSEKRVVLNRYHIALHYIKTYFVFDILSCSSFLLQRVVTNSTARMIIALFLVMRMVRSTTVIQYICDFLQNHNFQDSTISIVNSIMLLLMLIHWSACIIYLVAIMEYSHHKMNSATSWTNNMHTDMLTTQRDNVWRRYVLCLNCAASYIFFVVPDFLKTRDVVERIVFSILLMSGFVYNIIAISHFMQYFSIFRITDKYENQTIQLNNYAKAKKLPPHLMHRLTTFYSYKLKKENKFEDNELSLEIKKTILMYGFADFTRKVRIFQGIPMEAIEKILYYLKKEIYICGDIILHDNKRCDSIYFISNGTVAIYINHIEVLHLEDGDDFGVVYIKLQERQLTLHYEVKALEVTEIYRIEKRTFDKCLRQYQAALEQMEEMWENKYAFTISQFGQWIRTTQVPT